jgi:hypothetical protein
MRMCSRVHCVCYQTQRPPLNLQNAHWQSLKRVEVNAGTPPHVWAVVEIRHANHGWHPGLTAHLISSRGFWFWKLQGKTAGISVDRALKKTRFRSVPTPLEWAEKSKFTRNLTVIREWQDGRTFYFEGPAGTLPSRD